MNTHTCTHDSHTKESPVAPLAVAAGAVCGCFLLHLADPTTPGGPTPLCPTKAIFGINCPGCGSARMIYSLTHLDIPAAVHYNAVGVFALFLLAWSWLVWFGRTLGKRLPNWNNWKHSSLAIGIIIGVWFIIRLLPWEPFRSLQV
ncbi:MAG: DUF2752 domain-containing protein [Corynebacterium sp.]|nr:DUF2752 domain-containing protein [Corynebacterium sp.]